MSLVSTTSSIISILKLERPSGSDYRPPSDIRAVLLNFTTSRSTTDYQALVTTMRDDDLSDTELLKLMRQARECLPILNYDLRNFIHALSIINWTRRGDEVVKIYHEFLNDLVSAHSQYIKCIMDQLMKAFTNIGEEDWTDSEPVRNQKKQFLNVHFTLKAILEKVPLSENLLLEAVARNFPHYLLEDSHFQQLSYLYNLLQMTYYQPGLRFEILEVIVENLLMRDVYASHADIIKSERQGEMTNEMEVDKNPQLLELKHPVANTLDASMELIMMYIKTVCYDREDNLLKEQCDKLFKELLHIFGTIILPVQSNHVQFYMFYICSFRNVLVQQFLRYLWAKATSPSVPTYVRRNSISYMTALLTRAEYVLLGYVKIYLSKMGKWVNNYISDHCENCESNVTDHSVFYSICIAIFYVITYRHEDLVDSCSRLTFLQGLNLQKIVTSNLNPLRVCPPELAKNFADIACGYQLAYCCTIIENNMRDNLNTVDKNGNEKSRIMEMYFPFAPLLLPRTKLYIDSIYKLLNSPVKTEVSENEDKKINIPSQSQDIKSEFLPKTSAPTEN